MIPNEFKHNRKALGFTQSNLAYELGTHPINICHIERGIKTPNSREIIKAFRLLVADSAFMKALHKIQPILIDKNMFGVTYEDV